MSDVMTLTINGRQPQGAQNIRLNHSFDAVAAGATFEVVEGIQSGLVLPPVRHNDLVEIALNGTATYSGFVDEVDDEYDTNESKVSVRTREGVSDLIDSSLESVTYKGLTLKSLATTIAGPFGVGVIFDASDNSAFDKFTIEDGEPALNALVRAARHRGALVISDGIGRIRITKAVDATAPLVGTIELGVNALSAKASISTMERFRTTIVKGERNADSLLASDTALRAVALDDGARSARQRVVMSAVDALSNALQRQANWERNTRIGQGSRVTYTVHGYNADNGAPWATNTMVYVKDRRVGIDQPMLITGVSPYLTQQDGHQTEVSVTLPGAYDVQALPEAKTKGFF